MTDSDHLKSLITSTASALWEDKNALGKFLNVVRRSETFAPLTDTLERSEVRRHLAGWCLTYLIPSGAHGWHR
ncbi:hypothetical protein [Streptomyces griseofuscus]|uniref:hypothetical protein n=1 Tax=Streptomyces griseofuscus TaxID=146922 RepID=UPI0037F65E44